VRRGRFAPDIAQFEAGLFPVAESVRTQEKRRLGSSGVRWDLKSHRKTEE